MDRDIVDFLLGCEIADEATIEAALQGMTPQALALFEKLAVFARETGETATHNFNQAAAVEGWLIEQLGDAYHVDDSEGVEPCDNTIANIIRYGDLRAARGGLTDGVKVVSVVEGAGYVAVCREGGFWGAGNTPEEAVEQGLSGVADAVGCCKGADKLRKHRVADFAKDVVDQAPAEDEIVVFPCTPRVVEYLNDGEDGCVPWKTFGPIIDLMDQPDCDQLSHPAVNPWK